MHSNADGDIEGEALQAILLACLPCQFCRNKDEMYAESDRGIRVRIGCVCDWCMALEKDDTRTNWHETTPAAIAEWNEMNGAS